jgi:threonine/homoserine/homoserine lactone efflux protein
MRRHLFDPLSFIFGVAFVVLAGALGIQGIDVQADFLRWFGASLLLLLGVVMLLTSKSGTDRS